MKPTRYLLLLLIVISFTQLRCKKSETAKNSETTVTKTRFQYLTQKPWKMVAYRSDWMREGKWTDGFSSLPVCNVDDIYSFNTDGTAVRDMNKVICDPDLVKIKKGSWNWHVWEQVIYINDIGLNGDFYITYLDDDKMIVQAIYSLVTDEYTFVHP